MTIPTKVSELAVKSLFQQPPSAYYMLILQCYAMFRIEVTMTASTGGYKKVLNTESHKLIEQTFTGRSSSQMIRVIIDLLPPTHCATTDTCGIGAIPPVDVGLEVDNSVSNNTSVTTEGNGVLRRSKIAKQNLEREGIVSSPQMFVR